MKEVVKKKKDDSPNGRQRNVMIKWIRCVWMTAQYVAQIRPSEKPRMEYNKLLSFSYRLEEFISQYCIMEILEAVKNGGE